MNWTEIEQLPADTGTKMLVVIAKNISVGNVRGYTSDPYCVWQDSKGKFIRWPHDFKPTHFCYLPE